ncbi:MAG: imidazoleglycerol-phosphate dehydratase HisB [Euryarchaeota archaeon]|nr:imidazoleglycerol-phosphate dehydratase HisB [Euryarchaeota archaeon]
MRKATAERKTKETEIKVTVNLDGKGRSDISTTVPFFDHLLDSLTRHSSFDIKIKATGDNQHHIIEDVAIVLGQVLAEALGDKKGIARFGFAAVPMDDVLVLTAVDIGGRAYCKNGVRFRWKKVEGMSSQMVDHFLETLAQEARLNIHTKLLDGRDEHHKAEALFKSLAVALKMACARTGSGVPSTKGVI